MVIQIKNAIAHYNLNVRREKQKEMTMDSLAEKVFPQTSISSVSKVTFLRHWQSGNMVSRICNVKHIEAIEKATGYPRCKLIS